MQTMRRYSVGGQTLNVPASDNEEFMNTAASRGDQPDEIETYRVKGADGSVVTANVPRSQFGEFDALAASRGDVIDRVRRYRMSDGADVELSDSEAYNLVGRVARGREVSRKAWERAGLPSEYGKDAADRDAFGRMLAASPEFSDFAYTTYTDNFVKNGGKGEYVTRDAFMAQAERTLAELKDYVPTGSRGSQGFWSNRQQQATVNLGHEANAVETVGEMLPFVRSGLNAQSRMNDGVVQDIANGRFPDKDTMSAAARQFMTDEQWNSIPWMSPNLWQHLPQIQQAAQTYMAPRNEAVARAQESLRQHETTTAQDVVGGAADLGATLVEMSTPYGIVTKGVENTVTNGGDALKGFGGAAAEYAIWSKIPGGGKVGRHLGGALGENAAQIANNVLKSKLTEFTNNVVGTAVPEGERQGFGEWAESFFDIPGNAKTFLEFAIIHAATKGVGAAAKRATAAGRDRLAQAQETRGQIRDIFGKDTESRLTDEDVANLSRMVNSPSMTQENIGRLVKSVGENLDVEKGREAVNAGRRADTAAERAKRPSAEQSARLDEVISEYAPGEEAAAVRERVLKDIGGDKSVLDDPVELEKRVMGVLDKGGDDGIARSTNETGREVMGKIEREAERRRSARGAAERAERKAAEAEYEKAERERIEREKAEEAAVPEVGAETAAKEKSAAESRETAPEAPAAGSSRMTEWPEYAEWLGKTGKADSHKNWNRFVAENELDPALKVKRDNKGKPVEPDYTRPATIKVGELSPEEIAAGEAEGRRIINEAKKGLKRLGDRSPVEEAPTYLGERGSKDTTGKEIPYEHLYSGLIDNATLKEVGSSEYHKDFGDDPDNLRVVAQNIGGDISYIFGGAESSPSPESVGRAIAKAYREGYLADERRIMREAAEADGIKVPDRIASKKPTEPPKPDGKGESVKPKAESTTKTRSLEDIMADVDRANEEFEKAGRENDPSFEQKKEVLVKLLSEYDKALAEETKAQQGFIDAIERQADKNVEYNSEAGELGADGKPKPIDEATKSDLKTHYVFKAFEEGISDSDKLSSKEGVGDVFDMFKKLVEKYNPARDENGTISMQSVRRAAWMIESSDFATKEQKAFAHKYGEKFRTSTAKPVPDAKGKSVKPELNKPETITLTENDGKTYEVALPKIEIKPFEKAKTKEEWLARQKEIGALVDELKKKAPFHSVVNPKTGKYYESSSEAAKQRRREVFAYEEAVRRAADKAFKQVGEYNDSWDVESPKPAGARPVAETPEQFRERVKDDPVLRRLDAAQKRAKTPAERNAIADKFKARIEELRAQSPRDAASTTPQSGEKGARSASAETKPITQAASAEGRKAVSEAPAAAPKKLGDRKAPATTRAEAASRASDANGRVSAYTDGMKPLEKSRVEKVLNRRDAFGDGKTSAEHISSLVGTDAEVRAEHDGKGKVNYIIGDSYGNKTEVDFARHVGVKMNEESILRAQEEASMYKAMEKAKQDAHYKGFSGGDFSVPTSDTQLQEKIDALKGNAKYQAEATTRLKALEAVKSERIRRGTWEGPKEEPAKPAAAAEGKKTTAKSDGDIKELSKRLRSMKKTDNVPQELIDRMSKLSVRDLKKLEDEVAPMWTWANENVKRAIAYVRQMRGKNEKLVSVGNLKPKTKSAAPEVKDRLAAEREAALSAADESIAKRLKEIGASKEDADRLLAAIKSGKTDGGFTTAEIAREIEKRLGDKASEKVEIPLGGKAKAVTDSRLDNLVEVRSRLTRLGKEASKQYAQQTSAERQERLRSDPKVLEWARKNGREISPDGKVSPATVNDFQNESVKAAERMTRNLFREGNDVIIDKQTGRDYDPELDGKDGLKISKDGVTVGIYDPATRKVTLFRGADAETVYHELIGHAVEDYAKRNDATLYKKLQELVSDAPAELVEDVRRLYPDADASTLSKEIIARVAQGKGLEALSSKNAPKNWLARAYVTVRDAIMDFLAKTGLRRIDTDRMQNMTPMEAMDYLMREIGKGKTLGRLGVSDTTGRTSAGERWANRFFDRHTSLSKISKEAADAKALQPGREAEFQILKFNKKRDEYARLLRENDVTHETVADYMKTMAAKDRNDRLRREAMERGAEASEVRDDGSGLSPKEVQDRLDFYKSLDAERRQAIENVAKFLWKMQDEGLAERVRSGLLSEKEAQAFRDAEPNHAPLRSAIDPETGELVPWVGGKNMSSPEFRRAEGRFSEAGDVVAWMFEEYADAHLRAIENDTRRILADAIERNPALGTVYKGKVEEQRVRGGQGQANAVTFRTVNDKGESVRHTILLEGERGRLAASSYTGRDLVKPKWMEAGPTVWGHKLSLNNFMRFWSGTATEWSPTFAIRNLIADNIDIAQITLAEKGFKEGGKWLGRYAKNRQSLRGEVWEYARTGKVRDGSTLAEYIKAGGMIGGFEREGYNEIKDSFSYERMKKDFAKNPAKAVTGHVNNILKAINGYSELASRVASFKTDLADGMSAKEAALRARRITVDFNRKGNFTPVMNRLYMFSNSAIGATMRQLEAIRNGWKTAAGRRAIIGMAAYGVAEALAEQFMNAGDDENEKKGLAVGRDINEFTRKNSLYVRVGNRVFRLPAHDDPLMRLKYVANATTRFAMGSLSGEKWAKEVFGSALEDVPRFFGMGSRSFIDENRGGIIDPNIATWAPSGISWIFELRENRNYMGSPITKPKYDEALPDSWNGRESTSDVFQQMAKGLNELTGGNSGRSGVMDFAPETLQHVTSSLFKNAGRDTFMAIDVGLKLVTGNFRKVEGNKSPYARDFRRKYDGNDNRYFENRRAYDKDETELKRRTKAKDFQPGERAEFFKEHPWLRMLPGGKSRVHNLNSTIDRLRREERAAKTEERRTAVRERRMKLQATVNRIMEGRE